ncbi:DUF4012 domain-containing protein [Actinospongicola halichondriae]|uniref:DUF4012 domain-containing protein n=1 Tax=Actinospongicola halichondriae TaxID=3236844 RepID=UPI003D4998AF
MTLRRLGILLVVALVVAIPGVLGAFNLVGASRSLRDAERHVGQAAAAIRDGRIEDARRSLAAAELGIADANESLHAPSLALAGMVPVVQQNLASLRESVELAAVVVHGGGRILSTADQLEGPDGTLQVSLAEGTVPIDALAIARKEVEALLIEIPRNLDDSGGTFLLGPTRELHDAVRDEARARRVELERLDRGLAILDELVGGDRPRRYLVAVANTAEMRGTGGMMLNYGVLEGSGGTIELRDFGRVEELDVAVPVPPDSVGLPEDLLDRWDGFDLTREWRNTTVSADLPLVAPALQAMYERATGLPADGVIQIDPTGLARILDVVGPVLVEELGVVDAGNIEALVLNEAYTLFPGVEERSDVLGNVAEAAFRRLVEGEFPSVRDLAEAVSTAVDGRHLLVHSSSTDVENSIASFGADGSLPPADLLDSFHLTVQNVSGNKLDYYLDTSIELRGERVAGEVGELTAAVTVTNTAPPGVTEPRYVFGPISDEQEAGLYRGVVTLYLPTGSSLASSSGGPFRLAPSLQTEDGRPLISAWIDVPAGESRTMEFDLRLAPTAEGDYEIRLVPSPRVRPTMASVSVATGSGMVQGDVELDRTWVLSVSGSSEMTGY